MIKANVFIDNNGWIKSIKNPHKYLKNRLSKLSKLRKFNKKHQEFSILLTDNINMKKLNKKFRNINKSTDVLSFPLKNLIKDDFYIGDIALSYEFIKKRSKKTSFNYEFDRIWIHGYLHLIGYDHKSLKDFHKMRKRENFLLKNLNYKIDSKNK